MPERSLPPTHFPVWGWILMVLALAMFAGLLTIVFQDHRGLGRRGAPSAAEVTR